ncbi:hypothetical protein Leryth_024240 [Lithospermum erythrorhizon]|nr:hypothetical protein Leryth_024240 [Lithospermum erythrorhizon]
MDLRSHFDLQNQVQKVFSNLSRNFQQSIDSATGKTCRSNCVGFFISEGYIQYICMSWIVMFGLLLAIFPTVFVLLYLLHEKGVFDPLYDWWEDHFSSSDQRSRERFRHGVDVQLLQGHHKKNQKHEVHQNKHHAQRRRKPTYKDHKHEHFAGEPDHDLHNDKNTHWRTSDEGLGATNLLQLGHDDTLEHHRRRKQRGTRIGEGMEDGGHFKVKVPYKKKHAKQRV